MEKNKSTSSQKAKTPQKQEKPLRAKEGMALAREKQAELIAAGSTTKVYFKPGVGLVYKKSEPKKGTYLLTIPKSVKETIESAPLTQELKDKTYKFIYILLVNAKKKGGLYKQVGLPYTYLFKALGHDKKLVTDILEKSNIIKCDYKFTIGGRTGKKSKCYFYNFLYNEAYTQEEVVSASYTTESQTSLIGSEELTTWFKEDFAQLNIPTDELFSLAEERVAGVSISDCKINDEIPCKTIKITQIGTYQVPRPKYYSKESALKIASDRNRMLILDGDTGYIMTESEYLTFKRSQVRQSDMDALTKIQKRYIRATRNTTNNRLDTTFTNLPNVYMDAICRANNLKTIDVVNSQIAIMDRVMPMFDTEDRKQFSTIVRQGKFYEHIQELLNLKSRKEAKTAAFEMMFSSHKNRSENIIKLRKLLPNVMEWIDGYKKKHGDNQFAILLQKEESKIFIDGLLPRIKQHSYLCFTKHDSIIYKEENHEHILQITQQFFNEIGFNCQVKVG